MPAVQAFASLHGEFAHFNPGVVSFHSLGTMTYLARIGYFAQALDSIP